MTYPRDRERKMKRERERLTEKKAQEDRLKIQKEA